MAKTIGVVLSERVMAGLVVDHRIEGAVCCFPENVEDETALVELHTERLVQTICAKVIEVQGKHQDIAAVGVALPGLIRGDTTGRLKIIFHRMTHTILGVHIIGEGASELLHIGQAVMALGGKLDYFVDTVFNYPTLAECYKVAAFNGLNRVSKFE